MKTFFTAAIVLFFIMGFFSITQADTWYVDNGTISGDKGTSWKAAFGTIQEAINVADVGDEIWIKMGTYFLTTQINVDKPILIYGGFEGVEKHRDQRDWVKNITTVDGQNLVYHCFWVAADATIDGFTITGGNADSSGWPHSCGAGIFSDVGSPTIANCIIIGNNAMGSGGGMLSHNGDPNITNCIFTLNTASYRGGGFGNEIGGNPIITNCIFMQNEAGSGGGISSYENSLTITNCTFSKNRSTYRGGAWAGGGAIFMNGGFHTVTNCVLWGDTSFDGETEVHHLAQWTTYMVNYCNINQDQYGNPNESTDPNGNIRLNPLFVDPENEDYRLQSSSPCIDAATSNNAPGTDIEGLYRYDVPEVTNTGDGEYPYYDIGAHEYEGAILEELSYFIAIPSDREVILKWATKFETDNNGFNIYRADTKDGEHIKINASLISAEGSSTKGTMYEFVDKDVINRKQYWYKLEDVDIYGTTTMHGPVNAKPRLIYGMIK